MICGQGPIFTKRPTPNESGKGISEFLRKGTPSQQEWGSARPPWLHGSPSFRQS
jgi:hypothetical protein